MWQASALSGTGPLFERLDSPVEDCPLPELHPFEVTAADYELVGISCGPHPMSYLRGWLERRSVVTSSALGRLSGGRWVRIAGMVIVRQRPSTAKGMTFLTLEDETGLANVVVTPPVWERNRSLLVSSRALLVAGRLERRDGVVGVRGEVFEALDHRLPGSAASRDFH
ncbi:MAG: hypothetical protein D6806_17140 [Deltaproteobacteria bacterium]|nr:MAG: hypothetical protein D6806_17140 [Deltaproteobacteria bacterium]